MEAHWHKKPRVKTSLLFSALCILLVPFSAIAQQETEAEVFSLRLSVGYLPLQSNAPPERSGTRRFAFQAFFPGPMNSKALIEASYVDWNIGEPFRGQTSGIPQLHPPDWTEGRMIGIAIGTRIAQLSLGKTSLEPIPTLRLTHHLEKWYYDEGHVSGWPSHHSELQIAGELRLQIRGVPGFHQ